MKVNKLIIALCLVFVGYTTITLAQSKKKKSNTEQTDDENTDDAPKKSSKKSKKAAEEEDGSDADFKPTKSANRIEVDIKVKDNSDGSSSAVVVPVGEDGVILFAQSAEHSKDGAKQWLFKHYDTKLNEIANTSYGVNKSVAFFKYYFDKEKNAIYILMGEKGKSGSAENEANNVYMEGNVEILKYNIKNDKISSTAGMLPVRTSINSFVEKKGTAYFGGNTLPSSTQIYLKQCYIFGLCCIPGLLGAAHIPYHPILFKANLKEKNFTLETMNYSGDASVVNISTGDDVDEVSAAVANRPSSKEPAKMYLKNFEAGKLVSTYKFKTKSDEELTNASIYKLSQGDDLVFGTYAAPLADKPFLKKIQKFEISYNTNSADGFFISRFIEGKQKYLKRFNFDKYIEVSAPSSFFIGKKRVAKMIKSSMSFLLQNVIKKDDNHYVLIGDIFMPHYHTAYRSNGKTTEAVQVFDGWLFVAALVCNFDPEVGKMNWISVLHAYDFKHSKDNAISISSTIRPKVQILPSDNTDNIVAVYNDGKHIKSTIIAPDGSVTEGRKKTIDMGLKNDKDKVTNTYGGGQVDYWYGNYFIAYGAQRIKTKGQLFGGRRTIFYINKIAYKQKATTDD